MCVSKIFAQTISQSKHVEMEFSAAKLEKGDLLGTIRLPNFAANINKFARPFKWPSVLAAAQKGSSHLNSSNKPSFSGLFLRPSSHQAGRFLENPHKRQFFSSRRTQCSQLCEARAKKYKRSLFRVLAAEK